MAVISVSSTAALLAALNTARSGDTISLRAGTYSSVNIRGIDIAGNVTIQSADTRNPATLTDLSVRDSKGLTFRGLEFAGDETSRNSFLTYNSSNIAFDKLNVHGTMNGDPQDDASIFLIRSSRNVTVTNSEFQQLWNGIAILDNDGMTISGNRFHDIRTDGIRGGGTSNILIQNNSFTDFYPVEGDHPDAIQLWTTNTTATAHDITILNNVITRGDGEPMQGIFLRDESDALPFQNVRIAGNTMVGAMYNGISVDGGKGVSITDNQVIGTEGQNSWIRVERTADATVSGNAASDYIYIDNGQVDRSNNVVLAKISEARSLVLSDWVDGHDTVLAGLSTLFGAVLDATVAKLALVDQGAGSNAVSAGMRFTETLIRGTAGADRLTVATIGDSRIQAGAGNDTITGGAGKNTLIGGLGDDTYQVKGSGDVVVEAAGEGTDTVGAYISYTLGANVENLRMMVGDLTGHGNALDNRITGSAGDDLLYGEGGDDSMQGGAGDDRMYGGAGADTIRGDDGRDVIWGGAGDDLLIGGAGDDTIDGGTGSNAFEGGAGADRLTGGSGADIFRYRPGDFDAGVAASMDDIYGFSAVQKDKISLSAIDARSATAADDKFAFIGTQGFHKVAGELRYQVVGGDSYVMGDTNGDGLADFKIHVVGVTAMTAADFIL